MKNLDEDIILESFNLFYNRIPMLENKGNRQMIQDLMYLLRYFHISLYSSSLEGIYPNYIINEDGNLYSKLIDDIINTTSKKQYKYPLSKTITNKDDIINARNTIYNFLKDHPNLRLNDIVLIDYLLKNNGNIHKYRNYITENDIKDVKNLFIDIKEKDIKLPKVKKKSIL